MKQRFIFLLLGICLSMSTVRASGSETTNQPSKLLIHLKGAKDPVEVWLSDKPVITFQQTEVIITTQSKVIKFEIEDIDHQSHFEPMETDIEQNKIIHPKAGPTYVYSLKGILVKTLPEGKSLDLEELPEGIYIVKNKITPIKY